MFFMNESTFCAWPWWCGDSTAGEEWIAWVLWNENRCSPTLLYIHSTSAISSCLSLFLSFSYIPTLLSSPVFSLLLSFFLAHSWNKPSHPSSRSRLPSSSVQWVQTGDVISIPTFIRKRSYFSASGIKEAAINKVYYAEASRFKSRCGSLFCNNVTLGCASGSVDIFHELSFTFVMVARNNKCVLTACGCASRHHKNVQYVFLLFPNVFVWRKSTTCFTLMYNSSIFWYSIWYNKLSSGEIYCQYLYNLYAVTERIRNYFLTLKFKINRSHYI